MASDELTATFSFREGGTAPWKSPELFDPEKFGLREHRPTKESDCYALGMVIYELLSGRRPFGSNAHDVIARKVLKGERPGRPQGNKGDLFTDDIWDILELCWKHQPRDRISAGAVLLRLERYPRRQNVRSPPYRATVSTFFSLYPRPTFEFDPICTVQKHQMQRGKRAETEFFYLRP
jgi:serine/threonine protein kinase